MRLILTVGSVREPQQAFIRCIQLQSRPAGGSAGAVALIGILATRSMEPMARMEALLTGPDIQLADGDSIAETALDHPAA
jgi:hypothetical protein